MHYFCFVGLLIVWSGWSVQASTPPDVTRSMQWAHALDSLQSIMRGRFADKKTFQDARALLTKEIKPELHQKLLELQAMAEMLRVQINHMVALVPGMTLDHPSVKHLQKQLDAVEKQLNYFVYAQRSTEVWKLLLSVGAGMTAGIVTYNYSATSKKKKTLFVGLLIGGLVEYMLRGRQSLLLGNAVYGLRGLGRLLGRILSGLFGHTGQLDRLGALLEQALSKPGAALNKVFHNVPGTIGIGALALIVPVATYALLSRSKKNE